MNNALALLDGAAGDWIVTAIVVAVFVVLGLRHFDRRQRIRAAVEGAQLTDAMEPSRRASFTAEFLETFQREPWPVRRILLEALRRGRPALPDLIEPIRGYRQYAEDPNDFLDRVALIAALAAIDSPRWNEYADAVRLDLASENAEVREHALLALNHIAHTDDEKRSVAAIAVERLRDDAEADVRATAAFVIEETGVPDDASRDALIRATGDDNAEVRLAATDAVGERQIATPEAIAALAHRCVNDEELLVRESAANGLGALGAAASSALPALEKLVGWVKPNHPDARDLAEAADRAIANVRGGEAAAGESNAPA
jgi:HEAT repeat protein